MAERDAVKKCLRRSLVPARYHFLSCRVYFGLFDLFKAG
jgi:hypothetical protein